MNDILTNGWATYKEFSYGLSSPIYSFLLRANAMLFVPTAASYFGFINGWRHSAFQALFIVTGILIGLSIPLNRFIERPDFKVWLLPFLVVGLVYLPSALSFLSTPRLGTQQILRKRIHIGLTLLFVINLFWS